MIVVDDVADLIAALLLGVVLFIGIRSTLRLWTRYQRIAPYVQGRNRLLARAFVTVASSVTLAVGYFAIRTLLRIFDIDPPDWTVIVSYCVSLPVLLLPKYLEGVWDAVAAEPRE